MGSLKAISATLATVYFGAIGFLYFNQDKFVYFPVAQDLRSVMSSAVYPEIAMQSTLLDTKMALDGRAMKVEPSGAAKSIVLLFHGNGGNALSRMSYIHELAGRGARVFLAEYPGYGWRGGKPSEESIVSDALEILKTIQNENSRKLPVILFGESLGSAVAVQVAAKADIKPDRVVLVTPFKSVLDIGQSKFPIFPVSWLLRDTWRSDQFIKQIEDEVVFLIADKDEVVGADSGIDLIMIRGEKPSAVFNMPSAGHNNWMWHADSKFWDRATYLY